MLQGLNTALLLTVGFSSSDASAYRNWELARSIENNLFGDSGHSHTNLAFVLHAPVEPGFAQDVFNIPRQGNYIVSIKNPGAAPTRSSRQPIGLGKGNQAVFPDELKSLFHGHLRWIPADPASLLDIRHAEFMLLGVSSDLESSLKEAGDTVKELKEDDFLDASDEKRGGAQIFKEHV
ncbi:hypothetical protein DFJ73DRAFT_779960 [Zopfochytrium polystomum]|nr:hypothetical protein DFJ73DRAFT_779960 [Zopfochytrium polystomum]